MANEYNIDITGLTPEIADQIKKLISSNRKLQ